MVEPKRYQKKKRIYTKWDKLTEEVRIISDRKSIPPQARRRFTNEIAGISIDDKNLFALGAQDLIVYHKDGEFVLDFATRISDTRLKVVSRVIIPAKLAKKLICL